MGCDSHLYAEKKIDGKWIVLESGAVKHVYFDNEEAQDWQCYRNYDLFGFLAGVRRHNIFPLSLPKGFPLDASKEVRQTYKRWGPDAHTPSWYLLSDLLKVKNSKSNIGKYLSMDEYKKYKDGIPIENLLESYDYYSLEDNEVISNKEMDRRLSMSLFDNGSQLVTPIVTGTIDNSEFENFWETLDLMIKTGNETPDNLRIVFWFDN